MIGVRVRRRAAPPPLNLAAPVEDRVTYYTLDLVRYKEPHLGMRKLGAGRWALDLPGRWSIHFWIWWRNK